jgi:hypothetical protein
MVAVIADCTPRVTLSSNPLAGRALSPASAGFFLVNNISLLLDLLYARALRAVADVNGGAVAPPSHQTFAVS